VSPGPDPASTACSCSLLSVFIANSWPHPQYRARTSGVGDEAVAVPDRVPLAVLRRGRRCCWTACHPSPPPAPASLNHLCVHVRAEQQRLCVRQPTTNTDWYNTTVISRCWSVASR
jgi:hypothetical protein